jgi:cytochrome P450
MTHPTDPIAAVTHPDPYPYYARLVAERPVYDEPSIGSWVVSSAEAVMAVLTSASYRVRPLDEPVPAALVGSPAGEVFGRLVRMRDGAEHQPIKDAVAAALATIDPARVAELSQAWAQKLVEAHRESDIVYGLSVHVIGSLLGIPDNQLSQTAGWMSAFARCFSPISTPEQVKQGKQAAGHMWETIAALLAAHPDRTSGLLGVLAEELRRAGCDDDIIIANGIGLLWQPHDATAGLIGNTLVTLARHADLRERLAADPSLIDRVIAEVLRYDPPIQNTRRYVAAETLLAGQQLRAGDSVLVVLAAANRDPAANADPATFDPDRTNGQSFTFGAGPHACPGRIPAVTIARAGVEALLEAGVLPGEPVSYQPSANARIPVVNWNRSPQP